jgi:Xaa-Pro aminopeptidase
MGRHLAASGIALALLLGVTMANVRTQAGRPQFSTDFTKEAFAARRITIAEAIGPRGVALVQGAPSVHSSALFRQSNEFFYVTGVTVPQAYLLIDGDSKKSRLYLPHRDERRAATEGDLITAEDADAVIAMTGIDQVHAIEKIADDIKGMNPMPTAIYMPFQPAEGDAESRDGARRKNADAAEDPWDARQTREQRFTEIIRSKVPGVEVKDLSPALDAMRAIKDPQELAVIERATKIGGDAIVEAMRSTKPGIREAELDAVARFIFVRNGAQGEAYRAIVASGPSAMNQHHRASERALPGDELVVMDYCPDVSYYRCDVTRTWPVGGKFTGWQRELYGFYNDAYEAILYGIKPNATAHAVLEGAIAKMDALLTRTRFSKPEYEAGAKAFVDQFRRSAADPNGGSLGHAVGMSTHDMGGGTGVLKPGLVFTIEPALRVPEHDVYIRSEDMIVITPEGARILSDWVPRRMDAIEKAMEEPGLLQRYPAIAFGKPK